MESKYSLSFNMHLYNQQWRYFGSLTLSALFSMNSIKSCNKFENKHTYSLGSITWITIYQTKIIFIFLFVTVLACLSILFCFIL